MKVSRREILKGTVCAAAFSAFPIRAETLRLKGNINHSVSLWCYNAYMKRTGMTTEAFVAFCASLGVKSIELVGPNLWPLLKRHGMICSMASTHSIPKGLNRTENHDECLASIKKTIDLAAEAGFPNAITFSGNTAGMEKQQGLENCVTALKQIAPYAEEKKVTVCMEFLNSVNHKDYMGDSTAWFVEMVKRVNSPRVKVLYDIYHAAMMQENPMEDIRKHADCWAHYHTGGMPGRNEIGRDEQTLDYSELMKAVLATGFKGFVGQEFVPKKEDALASLKNAILICDV